MNPVRTRIVGVDVLRGVAVLGMLAAHIGDFGVRDRQANGWAWLWVVDGRSSATFAVLAGLSLSLMLGRHRPPDPKALPRDKPPGRHTHVSVLVRAVLLVGAGYMLAMLGTPVLVVLMSLGTMMALAMWTVRWSWWIVVTLAAGFAVGGPFLVRAVRGPDGATAEGWLDWPVVETLFGHYYTGLVWIAYLLVGVAVGRLPLNTGATWTRLAAIGGVLIIIGYVVADHLGGTGTTPGAEPGTTWWLSSAPHTTAGDAIYAPAEVVGNTGLVLVLLAVLLLAGTRAPQIFAPIAAVGALALTVYVGSIVAIWALRSDPWSGREYQIVWDPSNATLAWFWAVAIAGAWAWRRWLGMGPLERFVASVAHRVSDAIYRKKADPLSRGQDDSWPSPETERPTPVSMQDTYAPRSRE